MNLYAKLLIGGFGGIGGTKLYFYQLIYLFIKIHHMQHKYNNNDIVVHS